METSLFLFTSLDNKAPTSARKLHIRRLTDVLQLCIHRNNMPRARRAWAVLARCKEVHWLTLWKTSLYLLEGNTAQGVTARRIELLRAIILRNPADKDVAVQELILCLIISEQYEAAMEELSLYLPTFPYQDNPVFHIYAALVHLYLSQSDPPDDQRHRRLALSEFEHARRLDPMNVVAISFISKIRGHLNDAPTGDISDDNSQDEAMSMNA